MTLPKHKNPSKTRTASAPYNFVPLPEKVIPAVQNADELPDHDRYDTSLHTGYFNVTLTTRSPLYVRCPFTLENFLCQERGGDQNLPFRQQVRNTPEFFYTRNPGEPVIPGSSLRGMLRNLLEIVSYGKLSRQRVADRKLIYRAVGDTTSLGNWYRQQMLGPNQTTPPNMHFDYPSPLLRGGYLHRQGNQWSIRPAREIEGETFVHVEYQDAQPVIGGHGRWPEHDVFVAPTRRVPSSRGRRGPGNLTLNIAVTRKIAKRQKDQEPPPGMVPAVLVETGHIRGRNPKHMHCAIYEVDRDAEPIPIREDLWNAYESDRDITRGIPTRKLTTEGQAVFYLLNQEGTLAFFGSTMMFRLTYKNSLHNLIPDCARMPATIDYADALFGYVRDKRDATDKLPEQGKKGRAYASRVYVTDATLSQHTQPDLWLSKKALVPKILSSPKPTTFQHYLVQPASERPDLSHFDSPTEDAEGNLKGYKTAIRGHKLYWHQGERRRNDLEDQSTTDHSTQHTLFNPLREGVQFTFRVYFENLSDEELGALCWVLHPYGPEGQDYCHSLGMGKPLGMGAVKLEATLHTTDRKKRYQTLFNGNGWETGKENDGESLSDRTTLERLIKPFEEHLLSELLPEPTCEHIYGIKRIGMLLKMLEWPGYPSDPNGRLYLGKRPNTRYMQLAEFKQRPVLPDPSAFCFCKFESSSEPVITAFEQKSIEGNWEANRAKCQQDIEDWIFDIYTTDTTQAEQKVKTILLQAQRLHSTINLHSIIQNVSRRRQNLD
jgi:CRISPR-associated protein (TIGR03986 family)